MSASSLPPEIRRLSLSDRLDLVEQLWDSIAEDGEFTLTVSQREELDRRLAARAADPQRGSNWDEVRARLVQNR